MQNLTLEGGLNETGFWMVTTSSDRRCGVDDADRRTKNVLPAPPNGNGIGNGSLAAMADQSNVMLSPLIPFVALRVSSTCFAFRATSA